MRRLLVGSLFALLLIFGGVGTPMLRAQQDDSALLQAVPIKFEQETLSNGLHVIYAPLHQAPVLQVRVLYHVGSRDERPDRQGFAHMFEHMMFRGSAHVKPEEHMKLINMVGGVCNAFTSFDQTVYHDTIPSSYLEMALYLEADRMASFKVSEDIFKTERKVVAEEWRMGENRPYGTLYQDFLKAAFVSHSYRWTPIGNMEHLKAAKVDELQDFFNTYYVPNNATLVIAGDFDTAAAKALVHQYFGWIPAGAAVQRHIPAEPPQTQQRDLTVPQYVPLPAVVIGYHTPPYKSDDNYALNLLGNILGDGRSARIQQALVSGASPLCVNASAGDMGLEDAGVFMLRGTVLQGRDPEQVKKLMLQIVDDLRTKGVTADELAKAKTQAMVAIIENRQTAVDLATQLGDEALFGDDPNRVNTELQKLQAVTADDIKAMAEKYMKPKQATVMVIMPDPLNKAAHGAAATEAQATIDAPVAPATQPVQTRNIVFPPGYPTSPPIPDTHMEAHFARGVESNVNGAKVIVMSDHRLPLVHWDLVMRHGSHSEPAGEEGLAGLAVEMIHHGAADLDYAHFSADLDERGITLNTNDGGDFTRIHVTCTSDQLEHTVQRVRQMLLQPRLEESEFEKVKGQLINQLLQGQENPTTINQNEYAAALYGSSPFGRYATPQSVKNVSLDDIKQFIDSNYRPNDAILIFAGDVSEARGAELANQLLADWKAGNPAAVKYDLPPVPEHRHIILIDDPEAKQAVIRFGLRAFDISSDDKFAGSLAGQILSSGINSRLGEYVRAQRGLVYGIYGMFDPGRHGSGSFTVGTSTRIDATGETVEAAMKVLDDMRQAPVTDAELIEAKLRVAGSMIMRMQTIQAQSGMRLDGELNDYPVDYYEKYPARIGKVTAEDIENVIKKYVDDGRITVVVVAPASEVKPQLEKLGPVEVLPMPAKRPGAIASPSNEMMHSAPATQSSH